MNRQDRMAAFLARGGARPPRLPPAPKPTRAAKAEKTREPQRAAITRPRFDEIALNDAKALLAKAIEAKSVVLIGPRHLSILIALAEQGMAPPPLGSER
jgi:hypothetical protein